MDNRVGIDCGSWGWGVLGKGEQQGKMGTTIMEQQLKNEKKKKKERIESQDSNDKRKFI